jgi:hypothetical protein
MNKPFLSSVIILKKEQQQKCDPVWWWRQSAFPCRIAGGGLDPVEALKNQYNNKACHAVINFMYDLLAYKHDQGITEATQNKGGFKDVQWMEVD